MKKIIGEFIKINNIFLYPIFLETENDTITTYNETEWEICERKRNFLRTTLCDYCKKPLLKRKNQKICTIVQDVSYNKNWHKRCANKLKIRAGMIFKN